MSEFRSSRRVQRYKGCRSGFGFNVCVVPCTWIRIPDFGVDAEVGGRRCNVVGLSQRTSATSRQSSIQDNSNDNGESEMSSEGGGRLSKSEDLE